MVVVFPDPVGPVTTKIPSRLRRSALSRIESSPEGCRVRTILADWYATRPCAFCGKTFGEIRLSRAAARPGGPRPAEELEP